MKTKFGLFMLAAAAVAVAMGGCFNAPKITRTDTETSGRAVIGADECFEPIIKEELAVFLGLNPEAHIDVQYLSEPALFKAMLTDSLRLIVTTRELNKSQIDSLKRMKLFARQQRLAGDGIALIINKSNPDSLINVESVRKIMTGEIQYWEQIEAVERGEYGVDTSTKLFRYSRPIDVVFDNPNSSTLRFVVDSIVGSQAALTPKLHALQSNEAVLDYVSKTPDALGIIGVNWISNIRDTMQLKFNRSVCVMAVGREATATADNTYKPYPAFLNNGQYPFRRDVFIILTDLRETLPAGFVKFAAGNAGQRIILNAGLVPGTTPTREVIIKNDF